MNRSSIAHPTTTRSGRIVATLGVAAATALLAGACGTETAGGAKDQTAPIVTVPASCFAGQLADRWSADSGPMPHCSSGVAVFASVVHKTSSHQSRAPHNHRSTGSLCFMGRSGWHDALDGPVNTC